MNKKWKGVINAFAIIDGIHELLSSAYSLRTKCLIDKMT